MPILETREKRHQSTRAFVEKREFDQSQIWGVEGERRRSALSRFAYEVNNQQGQGAIRQTPQDVSPRFL